MKNKNANCVIHGKQNDMEGIEKGPVGGDSKHIF